MITQNIWRDPSGNPYLFPVLNPFHKTEQQKANRVHKVISKVNRQSKGDGKTTEGTYHIMGHYPTAEAYKGL